MIVLYKRIGETPLQAVEGLRQKFPEYKNVKLSYAGRLDPMAEGLLLVLVGEENKKRREYEHLDKEYEFEALIGISTDSYDLMGIPKRGKRKLPDIEKVNSFIKENSKKITQLYPPYSSIKVDGKPLYYWTRRGKSVQSPKKEIEVRLFEFLESYGISSKELEDTVFSRVSLVRGDFRQVEILSSWKEFLKEKESYAILKFRFACSSGGYVRSLVDDLGGYLKTGAVTFSIKRTKIGSFGLDSVLKT